MDLSRTLVLLTHLIGIVAGVSLRHEHSKAGIKRHMRREMELGIRYANLPFLSYEAQNNSVVVAQVGGSALLKCFTENLGEELVTWLKRDDEQLLTAGPQVYSSENRYSVSHVKHQKLWELKIRNVRFSDAGSYECQLTTHPPISILITLKVVEARAVIKGHKELHVHEGSRLKLVCHVEEATEPPIFIFWFHNGSMVNYEAKRPLSVTKQRSTSVLTISNVTRSDAGAYRCEPSNANSDNITLHVVADENAAMQRNNHHQRAQNDSSSIPMIATLSNSGAGLSAAWSLLAAFLISAQIVPLNHLETATWCISSSHLKNILSTIMLNTYQVPYKVWVNFETLIAIGKPFIYFFVSYVINFVISFKIFIVRLCFIFINVNIYDKLIFNLEFILSYFKNLLANQTSFFKIKFSAS